MGPELGEALRRVEQRLDDVEGSLDSAGRAGEKAGERIDKGATTAAGAMSRARRAAEQAERAIEETAAAAERADDKLREVGKGATTAATGFAAARKASASAADALERTERAAEAAARALDDAGDEAAGAGAKAATASSGWDKLWRSIDRNERVSKAWARGQKLLQWRTYRDGVDKFRESWERLDGVNWKGLQKKVNDTAKSFGRFRYALMALKFTAVIVGISALLGLLSALGAGAVAAVGSLGGLSKGLVAFLPVAVAAALAMKAWTVAAEALAPELDGIKKQFSGLGEAVAAGGLRTGLRNLSRDMEDFADITYKGFGLIGGALGRGATQLGEYLQNETNLVKFERIFARMEPIVDSLIGAVLNLAGAFVNVLDAAMPVGQRVGDDFEALTAKFRAWTDEANASGEMTSSIDAGYTQLVRTVTTLSNFMVGLYNVFRIAAIHAGWMGDGIESMSEQFKAWTESVGGQLALSIYFRDAMPAVKEVLLLLRDLVIEFAQLATAANLAPLIAKIRTELLPVFADLTGKIALDLGPAVLDLAIALGGLFGSIDTSAVQAIIAGLVGLAQGFLWLIENVPGAATAVSLLVTGLLLLGPAFAVIGWGITVAGQLVQVFNAIKWAIMAVRTYMALTAILAPGFWAALTGPIGIAVAVIAVLVAAFVWAYNNVEWFRNGVNAALSAVGGFFTWLWQDVIVPAWDGMVSAISTAWNGYILPVLNAIWYVLKFIGAIIFTVLVAPFVIAWNLLAALFQWAWSIIGPELDKISAKLTSLYVEYVQPIVDWIVGAWNNLMFQIAVGQAKFAHQIEIMKAIIFGLYFVYVKPYTDWIAEKWAWLMFKIEEGRLQFQGFLDAMGAKIAELWATYVAPILAWIADKWNWLMGIFTIAKQNTIDPIFDGIGAKLGVLQEWFRGAVDNIGVIWGDLKRNLAVPINFMIDKVWNNGVLKVWNWVAEKLGLPLGVAINPIPEFRQGGPIRGAGTGTSDSIVAKVSNGEHMWTKAEVDAAGGHQGVLHLRRMAREGRLRMAAYAGGGPVTPQEMFSTVRGALPATRMTSSYRAGDPGYHGRNRAADLAGPRSMDSGYMRQIDEFIGTKFPGSSELIYTPGPYNIKDGRPFTYSSGVRADHHDHVHWANNGAGAGEGGGGGGIAGAFWNTLAKPALDAMINPIISAIPYGAPPEFLKIPRAMATKAKDETYRWAEGRLNALTDIGGMIGGAVENVNQATAKAQVRAVALPFGWGFGGQWSALESLVQGESGWRVDAANPTSSARGLFQKMTSIHGPIEGTAAGQALWGLNYIKGKYGNPGNAYAKWLGRKPHWYDEGGMLPPGPSLVMNGTGHPEPVFTHQQWDMLDPTQYIEAMHATPPNVDARAASSREDQLLAGLAHIAAAIDERPPAMAFSGDDVKREVLAALAQRDREADARGKYRY